MGGKFGGGRLALLAMAIAVCTTTVAHAQQVEDAPCATPRRAVQHWLDHLQPGQMAPQNAARCFAWHDAAVSAADAPTVVRQLKEVLDTRGMWVALDDLPDSAEADGAQRVYLFPKVGFEGDARQVEHDKASQLPEAFLVRQGAEWRVSGQSIRKLLALHGASVPLDVQGLIGRLPNGLTSPVLFGLAWWQFLGVALVVLVGLVIRALVAWVVRNWVARLAARAQQRVSKEFVAKLALPVGTLGLAAWLGYMFPLLRFGVRANQVALVTVRVLAAVAGVIVFYRLTDLLSDLFARKAARTDTKLDDQLVPLLRRTAKAFVVILGGFFVLQNMNVDITSLLAVGTVGTLALSLAAKDTASNFFGSFAIFTDRPFQVGDWVVIGEVEGVVEEVGMRSTRIRTFQQSLVTMPNSLITVTPVDNFGVRIYRRCSTTLGVRYDTSVEQLEAFCDGIRAILRANPAVRKDAYEVHFTGFGAHALDVMLYFFFRVDSWSEELRQRHLVYLEILRLAEDLGVGFAFPTQTLLLEQVAEAERLSSPKAPALEALERDVRAYNLHLPYLNEWPTFNVADIGITVGVGLLVLDGFRQPKEETANPEGEAAATGSSEAAGN